MDFNELKTLITSLLDEKKADHIVSISLEGKGALVDAMIIASGTSNRHVQTLADYVSRELKNRGIHSKIEGTPVCDWVLLDTGDIIVHLFRPEIREFYNLEKMWGEKSPEQ